MEALDTINLILGRCSSDNSTLPPTVLYNEGWMLRLVLEWFSQQTASGHPLSFTKESLWYSEALIPSTFLPRYRGDKLAESWTHADGVIGQFQIGKNRDTDLTLLRDATTLKVLEAKMFSKLSKGITHAPYYNQAARIIACIAEILQRASRNPEEISILAFYLVAPISQIESGMFSDYLALESVREVVKRRCDEYDDNKEDWYQRWFMPTLNKIEIRAISWEQILSYINEIDSNAGDNLKSFYERCLQYNRVTSADE